MVKILALDLGTKTGLAWNYGPPPWAKTWTLATPQEVTAWGKSRLTRRRDPRILRLYGMLTASVHLGVPHWHPDLMVFEDVEFTTYTKQTQLWSAFRTAVWIASETIDAAVECVPVTTLKKFATGTGLADKAQMAKAMFTQYPDTPRDLDDNAIDALWILKWAEKNLSRMVL